MSLQLAGKSAIVTGGAGGIGAATARVLAERGAHVAVADIDGARAEATARAIDREAIAITLDLASEESIRAMIVATVAKFGRLDILHNNAADLSPESSAGDHDVETMDAALWDRVFRVNVRGTMLACKYALPQIVKQGGGSIINTASNLGLQGNVIQAAYSASKAAILQLTRSIAASHGRKGVRCNAVSPGLVLTPTAEVHLPQALREAVASETLTPYLGKPDDIAHVVAFLASDEARYVTGQNIVADGGTASHVPGFAQLSKIFGKE